MHSQFLFVEFEEGQSVEVLRAGTFVDRNGKEVEITAEDLEVFVAAFEAGATGQEVPIDIQHERAEAAGWIERLYLEGGRLLAIPDWNELGQRLVKEKIFRYLSATIDTAKQAIKSVSLVNFPAVKGLKPVELSEGIYTLQADESLLEGLMARIAEVMRDAFGMTSAEDEAPRDEGEQETEGGEPSEGNEVPTGAVGSDSESEQEVDMSPEELQEMREEIRAEVLAELEQQEKTLVELREQVRQEVETELQERFERRQGLVEFAEGLCGGEGAALAAKPEDVVEFLEGLDEGQMKRAKALLEGKVVDFSERGSSRDGRTGKGKLPQMYGEMLEGWIESGQPIEEFFSLNQVELGEEDDYDLSQFVDKEE